MQNPSDTLIFRLPEELLLQVAYQLPSSTQPKHLRNLSLTSRTFRCVAQEALHKDAVLLVSCGCHPKVNAVLKLLRTVYDRPDLAKKVKTLRFKTVRKDVSKLCAEQHFDLKGLFTHGVAKLKEMGYSRSHPWWRSLENNIESAYAGLLLLELSNLSDVDFWVKDHVRGPPSSECVTGLFGSMFAPEQVVRAWTGLQRLTTGDTHVMKIGIPFSNLVSLDLKTVSIGTVRRLNGRGSLQGTQNLQDLTLGVSMQFADQSLVQKAEIQFGDLIEALDCRQLQTLSITLINDGYHIGEDIAPEFDANYFLQQLSGVQHTISELEIMLESADTETELDYLLDLFVHPEPTWKRFTQLIKLSIPQTFLFVWGPNSWSDEDIGCRPADLPPNLESLEIFYPHEELEPWAGNFFNDRGVRLAPPSFKRLQLTCWHDAGTASSYFTTDVAEVWTLLSSRGIQSFVYCQTTGIKESLSELYFEEEAAQLAEVGSDRQGDGLSVSSADDDMPGLLDPLD